MADPRPDAPRVWARARAVVLPITSPSDATATSSGAVSQITGASRATSAAITRIASRLMISPIRASRAGATLRTSRADSAPTTDSASAFSPNSTPKVTWLRPISSW